MFNNQSIKQIVSLVSTTTLFNESIQLFDDEPINQIVVTNGGGTQTRVAEPGSGTHIYTSVGSSSVNLVLRSAEFSFCVYWGALVRNCLY